MATFAGTRARMSQQREDVARRSTGTGKHSHQLVTSLCCYVDRRIRKTQYCDMSLSVTLVNGFLAYSFQGDPRKLLTPRKNA